MAEATRLFILAGEPSGDRIGAALVRALRATREVAVSGVGGAELEGEGLRALYPMSDLSVMGVTDVLKRLPLLLWRARQTARAILRQRPDLVVLIDAQVFSETVARRLRRAGYGGPVLLYVAPSVWAWKPERAPALRPLYDEVLAVLPFEPAVMQRLGGPPTSYVGHPALAATGFRAAQPERGPLLLLPGSRRGELQRHLPLMGQVAAALAPHERVSGFVLPTPHHMAAQVRAAVATWAVPVEVTTDAGAKRRAFAEAVAAAAVSGTVTLELALSGVPMVITYVGDRGQMARVRRHRPRFVGLPNILADDALVPERIGGAPQPDAVIGDLAALLDDPAAMARQRAGFAAIRAAMQKGAPDAPLVDAALRVLAWLPQRSASGT
jgi:lipid-A-disaccharide synthase